MLYLFSILFLMWPCDSQLKTIYYGFYFTCRPVRSRAADQRGGHPLSDGSAEALPQGAAWGPLHQRALPPLLRCLRQQRCGVPEEHTPRPLHGPAATEPVHHSVPRGAPGQVSVGGSEVPWQTGILDTNFVLAARFVLAAKFVLDTPFVLATKFVATY